MIKESKNSKSLRHLSSYNQKTFLIQTSTNWTYTESPKMYAHLDGPQVLTMETMGTGFVVWLVSLSFVIFVFLLDWIVKTFEMSLVRFIANKTFKSMTVVSQNK